MMRKSENDYLRKTRKHGSAINVVGGRFLLVYSPAKSNNIFSAAVSSVNICG